MSTVVPKPFSLATVTDETFTKEDASHCHLSVEIGFDTLSFAVLDVKRNKYIALESFSLQKVFGPEALCAELKHFRETLPFLGYDFKSVGAGFVTSKFTLVPKPLFDEGHKLEYLTFNHKVDELTETVLFDELKNCESILLFALPIQVKKTLEEIFKKPALHHQSGSLIELIISENKNKPAKKTVVHIQASHFEIVVTEGKKLLFFNSFAYQSSEDFIYYLLFVCEQLNLNPEESEVYLCGEIERNSAIYSIVQKYIRNVSFTGRPEGYEYSYGFNNTARHFYYNLFSLYLCA
jgi:hypothetical protein